MAWAQSVLAFGYCRSGGILLAFLFPFLLSGAPKISPSELESEISSKIEHVSQFKFIKELAEKMGVKVWLFGGTAAGFGHYVRWDLERRKGDQTYQAEKFDYNYLNIYRPTQDCDLVIDGTIAQAEEFEAAIQNEFPHLQGSKIKWEVRLLNKARGDKEALLKNPDFLNQNTDSNSIGMIELTDSKSRVKDLRDWNSESSGFLTDLAAGRIRYLPSEKHKKTKRFREGKNPHIFSVIRFLIKVFQYDLEISPEDRKEIIKKIRQMNETQDLSSSYAKDWIERNAKKLYQQTVDLERAGNTLGDLGLRKKLIDLGASDQENSMSWWLNREPLGTHESKSAGGAQTAGSLGITIVAHETKDFFAYEAIMKSPRGLPNVFISRANMTGEVAAYGDGFYTKIGSEGARDTGFTIRFAVNANAVEGKDFKKIDEFILVFNRAMLKVIPESLQLNPHVYLSLILQQGWKQSDRGLLERFKYLVKIDSTHNQTEVIDSILLQMAEMKAHIHNPKLILPNPIEALTKFGPAGFPFSKYAVYFSEVLDLFGNNPYFISKINWQLRDFFELARKLLPSEGLEFIKKIGKTSLWIHLLEDTRDSNFLPLFEIVSSEDTLISDELRLVALKAFQQVEFARRGLNQTHSPEWRALMDKLKSEMTINLIRAVGKRDKEYQRIYWKTYLQTSVAERKSAILQFATILEIPTVENELSELISAVEEALFYNLKDIDYEVLYFYLIAVHPKLSHSKFLDLIENEIDKKGAQASSLSWDFERSVELAGMLPSALNLKRSRSLIKKLVQNDPVAAIKILSDKFASPSIGIKEFTFIYLALLAVDQLEKGNDAKRLEISEVIQKFYDSSGRFKAIISNDVKRRYPEIFEALKYYFRLKLLHRVYPIAFSSDENRKYSNRHFKKALDHLIKCRQIIEDFVEDRR